MLDSHVKRYLKVPKHLLRSPTPPKTLSQSCSKTSSSRKSQSTFLSKKRRNRRPLTNPVPKIGTTIHPESRLQPQDNTIPEMWIKSMMINDNDYGSLSLNELARIEKANLLSAGLPPMDVDRIFRGLFVYSFGVYELLQDITAHCTEPGRIVSAAWTIYLNLLETIPSCHPHLLGVFIGAEDNKAENKLQEQQRMVKELLATQRLLEQRSIHACALKDQAEDSHALTSARLGSATSQTLNATVLNSELRTTLKELRDDMLHLKDHNTRLENKVKQVPGLKKHTKDLVIQTRKNDIQIHSLTKQLEDTSSALKMKNENYITAQFKLGVLSATKHNLKSKLQTTSSQLQQRNLMFCEERDMRLNLLKEVRTINSNLHRQEIKNQDLLLLLNRTGMKEEHLRAEHQRTVKNYKDDESRRNRIMQNADLALNEAKAREACIVAQEKQIAMMDAKATLKDEEISRLGQELLNKDNLIALNLQKNDISEHALADAASTIAHLEQDIKDHLSDKEQLSSAADSATKNALEAQQCQMTAEDRAQRARCRADAADEERRRTAIDCKAIEDGLRIRVISAQKDLDEAWLETKKMEQYLTGQVDTWKKRAEKSQASLELTKIAVLDLENDRDQKKLALENIERHAEIMEGRLMSINETVIVLSNECQVAKKRMIENKNNTAANVIHSCVDNDDIMSTWMKQGRDENEEEKEMKEIDADTDTDKETTLLLFQVSQHLNTLHSSFDSVSSKVVQLEANLIKTRNQLLKQLLEETTAKKKVIDELNRIQKKYNNASMQLKEVRLQLDVTSTTLDNEIQTKSVMKEKIQRNIEVSNLYLKEILELKSTVSSLQEQNIKLLNKSSLKPLTNTASSQTNQEERDSEMLGRAKWLMAEANKVLMDATKAEVEALGNGKSTREIGLQVSESELESKAETKDEALSVPEENAEKNERCDNNASEKNETNENIDKNETKNSQAPEEKDFEILLTMTQGVRGGLAKPPMTKIMQESETTPRKKQKNQIGTRLEDTNESNFGDDALPHGPPPFVAAALRRMISQRIDDPAMWNAMWSTRGGAWSFRMEDVHLIHNNVGDCIHI